MDIPQQNLLKEDSYVVIKIGGPCAKVFKRLGFLNDFLAQEAKVAMVGIRMFIKKVKLMEVQRNKKSQVRCKDFRVNILTGAWSHFMFICKSDVFTSKLFTRIS